MSLGKSGGTTVQTAELTPEQRAMIGAQTDLFTSTIAPAYRQYMGAAQDIYNQSAPGTTMAGQNLAGVAGQAQQVFGSTGESALRTGVAGLENLFSPDYERQQLAAALVPAQQQYLQNLAGQQAQFGGSGQLGSARQALANTALAGQTQAAQQQAAAQVAANIANQRAAAAQNLATLGQGGLAQAIGAAQQGVAASQVPISTMSALGQLYGLTPGGAYTPNFSNTQGFTRNDSNYSAAVNFGNMFRPGGQQ